MSVVFDGTDLLVFSHLKWDNIVQRPHHLLSRQVKHRRVFYFEGPTYGQVDVARLTLKETAEGIQVVTPHLPQTLKETGFPGVMRDLVDEFITDEGISNFTLWHYDPTATAFTKHLKAYATIYDCMEGSDIDEDLISSSDLVFIESTPIFNKISLEQPHVHHIPQAIDYGHFSQGRLQLVEPDDQVNIPHPRIGFYGALDNKFDKQMLNRLAELRPEYQFIILGSIHPDMAEDLPLRENIHYLGEKDYHTAPLYLSGWDCVMLPLTAEDTACYKVRIQEFLASGRPVVSTSLRGDLDAFRSKNFYHCASSPEEFLLCIDKAMEGRTSDAQWLQEVDSLLEESSWDETFIRMATIESEMIRKFKDNRVILDAVPPLTKASDLNEAMQ